jgi:uncharacterized membrane protein YhaH (DUF805 family)
MDSLALLFSTSGRIQPKPFVLGIVLVYALIFASQILLAPPIMARSGVVPFAVAQAALTWAWYALHAKRLRDAGRGSGLALAVAILYGLGVLLFLLLIQFITGLALDGEAKNAGDGLATIVIILFLIALLSGDLGAISFVYYVALTLLFVILMPLMIALVFSIWAGTRKSRPAEIGTPDAPP